MAEKEPRSIASVVPDGRHLRSTRSRAKIVAGMLKLLRSGNLAPSAAEIATAAKVSLRTVFRHFDDMDGLYSAIALSLEGDLRPLLSARSNETNWQDRLADHLARRAEIYEKIMPFKIAADARRHRSDFLQQAQTYLLDLESKGLRYALPPEIVSDESVFSALQVATSFDTWRQLRNDQEKPASDAQAIVSMMVAKLVG